jgi:hypothetical protein
VELPPLHKYDVAVRLEAVRVVVPQAVVFPVTDNETTVEGLTRKFALILVVLVQPFAPPDCN